MLRNLMIAAVFCTVVLSFGLPDVEVSGSASVQEQPQALSSKDPMAPRPVNKNVIAYATQDAGMNAAKARARATLPRFLALIEAGTGGAHTVKYPLTQGGATEHIWVQVSKVEGANFIGRIANEPVNPGPLQMGDAVEVARADIEDWMINTGSEIYGGYTARYAMKDMPREQAAEFKKMFRD